MTTELDALLADLSAAGVILTAAGDKLRIEAPAGAITPELRARLAEHKAALLARLIDDAQPAPPEIVRIPLDGMAEHLQARGLRVIGGTPHFERPFRPMLFLAETTDKESDA